MNNSGFIDVLKRSFIRYLETGERSNEKLKVLHGAISADLSARLDKTNDTGGIFEVSSLGFGKGKEKKINGRYVDKSVDITIGKGGRPVAGIAVKYVMSNYMQNSNNYFEGMLGETANIRCREIPYFQMFIIPDSIPYFKRDGSIGTWEHINEHNMEKYITLSGDCIDEYMHTPNKTLVYVVNISESGEPLKNKEEYGDYYRTNEFTLKPSSRKFTFSDGVVYNDYEKFIKKATHLILSV